MRLGFVVPYRRTSDAVFGYTTRPVRWEVLVKPRGVDALYKCRIDGCWVESTLALRYVEHVLCIEAVIVSPIHDAVLYC